jgi:hypothetical protein
VGGVTKRSAAILLALLCGFLFGLATSAPSGPIASWCTLLAGAALVGVALLEAPSDQR